MAQVISFPKPDTSSLPAGCETIGDLIRWHASLRPQHAAVVAPGFPSCSYEDLVRHVDRTGAALRAAGLNRSSRVAILLPSGPELALTGVAVACNAVAVPSNPAVSALQIEQLHARLDLSAVVLPAWLDTPPWLEDMAGEFAVLRVSKATASLSEPLFEDAEQPGQTTAASPDEPALTLQTSGTIGPPKLVPVSHRNLMAMARRMEHCFELSHLDRCACLLPLYYAQGIKSACIVPLLLGGSIAIPQAPVLDTLEAWLAELQPTWFPTGPTFLQAVLDRVRGNAASNHNLRFLISGSASLPEQVRTGVEASLGIPVLDAWGMTEIGLMTGNSIRPGERKSGTVGYAFPDEVAIMADNGKLCRAGQTGEVVVRGPSVLGAYLDDDALNRNAFAEGWFRTGDLGAVDRDGYLSIAGRIKEIINRGGEKISPDQVERALRRHPAVREAAAFAVPHPRLGEDVAAAVVVHSGAGHSGNDLAPSEIQRFVGGILPPQAIPRTIFFLTALPKGQTGKILRRELSASCQPFTNRTPAPPEGAIESRLVAIWQRLLQRTDIGVDDDFFAAGGDSLLAAQMLLDAERITHRLLRGRMLPVPATIHALAQAIDTAEALPDEALTVRVDGDGSGAPFFYCHGDYMFGGRYAYRLAELAGEQDTFWLLNNYNLSETRDVPTIEELAAGYVPQLLAAMPTGAFRLGGHCNGGLMALELARQLTVIGREVELIILIEPISLNARPLFRGIARILDVVFAIIPGRSIRRILRAGVMFQLWRAFRWACERLGVNSPSEDDPASWALESRQTRLVYQRLMANYLPPSTPARIVCLTAAGSSRAVEFDWKPWRRLSPDVEARVIPGNHISCLTNYVDSLAQSLTEALAFHKIVRHDS